MDRIIFLECCEIIEKKNVFFKNQPEYFFKKNQILVNNIDTIHKKQFYELLDLINDNHSFWIENTIEFPTKLEPIILEFIDQKLIIKMKYIFTNNDLFYQEYIDNNNVLINSIIDNNEVKELVFDLRENSGGNLWVMLASVGFLFKNKIVGYFQSYKGIASPWEVLEDRIIADNYCYHFISPKKNIDAQKLKISAIVGKETYSSGEAFCIALMAIDCKITGERTGGFTSGNEKYILSNGSIFYHSESFFKDVHSNIYYSGILPENIKV